MQAGEGMGGRPIKPPRTFSHCHDGQQGRECGAQLLALYSNGGSPGCADPGVLHSSWAGPSRAETGGFSLAVASACALLLLHRTEALSTELSSSFCLANTLWGKDPRGRGRRARGAGGTHTQGPPSPRAPATVQAREPDSKRDTPEPTCHDSPGTGRAGRTQPEIHCKSLRGARFPSPTSRSLQRGH